MRYTEILAIAMGNLAAAQLTTRFTDTIASAIEVSTPAIYTGISDATRGIRILVSFNFLRCFSSANSFLSFTLGYLSIDNDANLYTKVCLGSYYFSIYKNKYYCGSKLNFITFRSISAN